MARILLKLLLLATGVLQLQTTAAADVTAAEVELAGELVPLPDVELSNSAAGRQFLERVVGKARVVALGEPHHAYNAGAAGRRKIRFYGLEMMGHVLQTSHPAADRPLRSALQYMASVDQASAAAFRQRTDSLLAQLVSAPYPSEAGASTPYDKMGTIQQNALTVAIADAVSLFQRRQVEWIAKSSRLSYERAYRHALNAAALDADFRTRGWWLSREGDRGQRDAMSASNLKWALEQEGAQGRILVFAANAHVSTSDQACVNEDEVSRWTSMGAHAKQWLGDEMISIAAVGGFSGAQCDVNCKGIAQLACLLSSARHSVAALHPGVGAAVRAKGFDAIVYVKEVTAVADP